MSFKSLLLFALSALAASATPVQWADWTSTSAGTLGGRAITVTGAAIDGGLSSLAAAPNVAWAQTGSFSCGVNLGACPDFAPVGEYLAYQTSGARTITFSGSPVGSLYFALFSLNAGNITFSQAFGNIVVSGGNQFGSPGGLVASGGNTVVTATPLSTSEGNGVMVFSNVQSITFTSSASEFYSAFTVGEAVVPEPGTLATLGFGLAALMVGRFRRR